MNLAVLLVMVPAIANADDKILECAGTTTHKGMNVPEHAKAFIGSDTVTQHKYILRLNSIATVSDSIAYPSITLKMCKVTESHYFFSQSCEVTEPRRMAFDWIRERGYPYDGQTEFSRKWSKALDARIEATVITLDRVSLDLQEEDYDLFSGNPDVLDVQEPLLRRNYVIVGYFNGSCRVVRPKF